MFFFDFLILLVFFCCMGCERTTEKIIRDLNCKSAIETENGKTMDEELSEEELLHFNKMFFTQSQEENPYVRCLTSLYHDPKDMNIFLAFYGGSDSAKVTDENERERVMGAYNQEGTLLKISKTKMNEFLMRYIGLPVDETNKNGIELIYLLLQTCYRPRISKETPGVTAPGASLLILCNDGSEFFGYLL